MGRAGAWGSLDHFVGAGQQHREAQMARGCATQFPSIERRRAIMAKRRQRLFDPGELPYAIGKE
jgi:hypothetical protein